VTDCESLTKLGERSKHIKMAKTWIQWRWPIAALVKSLEASSILVAWQGCRESTVGSVLTLHQSLRARKAKRMCLDPWSRKKWVIAVTTLTQGTTDRGPTLRHFYRKLGLLKVVLRRATKLGSILSVSRDRVNRPFHSQEGPFTFVSSAMSFKTLFL
jgi:hypothetical protein